MAQLPDSSPDEFIGARSLIAVLVDEVALIDP
jgi:hypothetical protein